VPDHLEPLLATLERRDDLSATERDALVSSPWLLRRFSAESEIISFGQLVEESCFIAEGFAARTVHLMSGARQFTSVHVLGDFVDLHGLLLRRMDHDVVALTDCRMAFLHHSRLKDISTDHPHLWRLLSTTVAIDGAIQRQWIAALGRRQAPSRLAHLLCELFVRLEIVGVARDYSYQLPITQHVLADVLGLSVVHTNRALQELRARELVSWKGSRVCILDWSGLARLGEFSPEYLNLVHEPR
jgi:CRP-like cAMP-binding protein